MASCARKLETEKKSTTAKINLIFIAMMHNITRRMALPDGCQFLTLACSAIQGVHSNATLTGIS